MINIAINPKNAYKTISSMNISQKDTRTLIKVVKNILIILLFLVSSMGPILGIMATQNVNSNISNKSNSNQAEKNQISTIPKNTLSKDLKVQSHSGQLISNKNEVIKTSQITNSNNNNNNMKTNNFQTITGTPSNNNLIVNETADLSYTNNSLSTANTYTSTANTTQYSYTEPSGYTNISNTFDVSNITSTTGVYTIWNGAYSSSYSTSSKSIVSQVASSITITQQKVNLTEINAYMLITSAGNPQLNVSIVNAVPGAPDTPNSSSPIVSTLLTSGGGWTKISFSKDITLSKGTYFIIFNDVSSDGSYFTFRVESDTTTGNQSVFVYNDNVPTDSWVVRSYDQLLQYSYIILNPTNIAKPYVFTSPDEVFMQNNGRNVTSLTNNYFDYTSTTMQFSTNVSVTFSVTQHASVFLSTPSTPTTSYLVNNNTISYWNVSFTGSLLSPGSFSVSNRTFTLTNIDTSWNATTILNGTITFDTNIPFSSQVTYPVNGSTSLAFNTSTDLNAHTWTVEFQAKNYVTSITLNNGKPMSYPYVANSSDTLSISSNLVSGTTDGYNGTVEIFNQTSKLIYKETNIQSSSDVLTFSNVVLSSWINNNNPNGTYVVTVQWLDSSTQTKIGYYELDFTINASTTLQVPATIPDTIGGQSFSLSIGYLNSLNSTNVNGATVLVNNSWSKVGTYLTNTNNNDNYTGSISTTSSVGTYSILITTSLPNYVTQTANISLNVVHDTTLTVTPNATSVQYFDVVFFSINYADLAPTNISGATVNVNGSSAVEQTGAYYTYSYNTSQLPDPTINSIAFTINANETFYLGKSKTVYITLLQTDTNFVNYDGLTNNTVVNQYYASNTADLLSYTFSYNDTRHNTLLQNANLASNYLSSDFTVTGTGTQTAVNFTVTLDPKVVGTFPISFTFSKAGYKSVTFIVVFNIQQTSTQLLVSGSSNWSNNTNYTFHYGSGYNSTFNINLTLYDLVYKQNITTSGIAGTLNSTSDYILVNNSILGTGTYNFSINPLLPVNFTLTFTLYSTKVNSYQNQTIILHITMLKSFPVIPKYAGSVSWTNGTTFQPIYNEANPNSTEIVLYITSVDTIYYQNVTTLFNELNPNSGQYEFIWTPTSSTNETWKVVIIPINAGDSVIEFDLSAPGFNSIYITLHLHTLMPTNNVTYKISSGINATISNSTSKLGYTLEFDSNWNIYNNSQVSGFALSIYRNGTLISGSSTGITALAGSTIWNSKVRLNLLPDYGYTRGWYQFNFTFSKYGYINQTYSVLIYIAGFDLKINLSSDNILTQGSPFNIYANVTYANGSLVAAPQTLMFYKISDVNGLNQNINSPVNAIDIYFNVSVTFVNGTNGYITGKSTTNIQGVTTYTIPGTVTKDIAAINSISAYSNSSNYSDFSVNSISPTIEIQKVTPFNWLFIIIPVIVVIILFLVGIFFFRRRSKKNARIKAIYRGNMAKVDLPNSVYSIMLTTNTGLPVLTRINAVYSKSKAVEELISGLSVGIDTFLSSFQSDFMSKLGTVDQTKVDPNNPHKVFMSAIKRNEFHVLIIASPGYRGFVFLKDVPSSFAEQTFFKMVEQVQAHVQIDVVFDEDEVKADVGKQINKLFPFKLLDKFVLNAEKIVEAENNAKLSKPAAEALMRVFAITTGAVNINETPQKQVAQFHKVLRKNAAFSGASDSMDAIKSGVLFYNTIFNMMQKQLKIPAEVMVEALWDANLKDLGIYELV